MNSELFFANCGRRVKEVDVPGFGTVKVRGLSARHREKLGELQQKGLSVAETQAHTIVMSVINGDGNPCFAESDVTRLVEEVRPDILDKLSMAIMDVSDLSEKKDLRQAEDSSTS